MKRKQPRPHEPCAVAVVGNLERAYVSGRDAVRLTEDPQVAFLGATDPTADRQTGESLGQINTNQIGAEKLSQG